MKPDLLHSLFHDLQSYGSVRLKKSKLLWMLGRAHETHMAWDLLMRQWRASGGTQPIYGLHWGDEVTLTMAPAENIGAEWATRREPARPQADTLPLMLAAHG